jgi:hypothetical protein
LLAISLPSIVFASLYYGTLGAAYANFVSAIVGLIGILFVFTRVTGAHLTALLALMWRPMIASIAMALIITYSKSVLISFAYTAIPIVLMVCLIFLGVIFYALGISLVWWLTGKPNGAEKILFKFVGEKIPLLRG